MYWNAIAKSTRRRQVRLCIAYLCFIAATSAAWCQSTAATLAGNLQTEGQPWIYWSLRIVGGMMAIGGLLQLVGGFTGNEEGYHKVVKVGGGILLMSIGVYVIAHTDTLYTTLNLGNLFTVT